MAVKAEVRVLFLEKDHSSLNYLCNLVQLSRGKMIGVNLIDKKDLVGELLFI
jgi:hypothetical protein